MTKAFAGIRVLDFSQVLAGPSCTQNLALLGADVIKIEEPSAGDQSRGIMADNDIGRIGMSPYFLSMNANKRSMTLDLKHPRAAQILARLAATADVVVQNFRPGVLTRLGFGYDAVRAIKPDIIYCSISGYGQTGPFSTAPAYDGAVQAVSGLMAVTGQPDGPPTRVGSSIVDLSTAMMAAFAIASALFRRSATGDGQHVDVAMFDTALALMAPMASVWLNTGRAPERLGNGSPAYVPTADSFPAGKGDILIVNGPQVSSVIERVKGCNEEVAKHPGVKVLSQDQDAKGSRDGGLSVGQSLLTRFTTVNGVFAINDPEAIGVELAAKQLKRTDFPIVSVDGAPDAEKALADPNSPQFVASASQDPFLMARLAVQEGVKIMAGGKPEVDPLLMDSKLVTRENVKDYKGWTAAQ